MAGKAVKQRRFEVFEDEAGVAAEVDQLTCQAVAWFAPERTEWNDAVDKFTH